MILRKSNIQFKLGMISSTYTIFVFRNPIIQNLQYDNEANAVKKKWTD